VLGCLGFVFGVMGCGLCLRGWVCCGWCFGVGLSVFMLGCLCFGVGLFVFILGWVCCVRIGLYFGVGLFVFILGRTFLCLLWFVLWGWTVCVYVWVVVLWGWLCFGCGLHSDIGLFVFRLCWGVSVLYLAFGVAVCFFFRVCVETFQQTRTKTPKQPNTPKQHAHLNDQTHVRVRCILELNSTSCTLRFPTRFTNCRATLAQSLKGFPSAEREALLLRRFPTALSPMPVTKANGQ